MYDFIYHSLTSLPSVLTNFELVERIKIALGPFGSISSVKASRDGNNRPYAFVRFQVHRHFADDSRVFLIIIEL